MQKVIKLSCHGIVVTLSGKKDSERPAGLPELPAPGSGTITSDLHEPEPENEDPGHDRYEAAIDAVESMILAHACAGVDIASSAYAEGIETAVDAIGNNS